MKIVEKILKFYQKSDRFFYLLVGLPSYDKYLEHMYKHHPDKIPQNRKEFFKEAQERRYNSFNANRC
ncbi:KCU-star family selenoprotein [Helicobacter sp. 13S00477-4]|uniref:KCU-star family selenoprotein n=1 Tax=Helicobacter sp. 13S00477-4 TaxID=1905759 RepID=UPI000BA56384|nr:KCU-star family selenoprotein [Helicobacter sp. 13S00477-4]PAF51491.1 hypothetical protein BKH44_05450 [Helicobacter sp. 13S00477-4]